MIQRSFAAAVAALSVLTLPGASVEAQASNTLGLMLGGHIQGASLQVEGGDRANAAGIGVRLGYGVSRNVTLFAQFDGAEFDVDPDEDVGGTWTMGHGDLGARFHFPDEERSWVPYLEAALTGRVVSLTEREVDGEDAPDIDFSGGAFTIGGGLMFYFNESVALDLQLLFSGGEFTEIDAGPVAGGGLAVDADSSRLSIGVTGWP